MTETNQTRLHAAQQAAQASATEAGSGPTDTIAASCDLIRAGVFFDGTGNSRDHVPVNGVTWHTNVDLLERQYRATENPDVENIDGQPRNVLYLSRYMRGIGVDEDGTTNDFLSFDDGIMSGPRGMGWGTGPEGVESRVAQTMDLLTQDLHSKTLGMQPCDIWFDVFGFSRGAIAARDFANGVLDEEIEFGSSKFKVKFMGLLDTVSSMGEGGIRVITKV
ncbi:hypothetical protein [Celeribacter sp.]|uniref:hypothetical protein n=1 Tax=Celeribacter sp. TaxID=1890673 RepID=UPI003A90350F